MPLTTRIVLWPDGAGLHWRLKGKAKSRVSCTCHCEMRDRRGTNEGHRS